MTVSPHPMLADADSCTGCGACAAVCARGAISFEEDGEGFRMPVVDGSRCVECGACKIVLSGAKLVVTSRFHALVSALAEGVPALCTSWSHKYQELVSELGCPQSCIDVSDVASAIAKVESALHDPVPYTSPESARSALRGRVEQMWNEVFAPFN